MTLGYDPAMKKGKEAAIVTVSFRGDAAVAGDLCKSIDAFVPAEIEHVVIVPRRDRALFEPLAGGRRRIVFQEDLLPSGWHRLPLPSRIRLPFFQRRLRDFWLTPHGVVRGWLMQQIVKLSVERATEREIIVFADSDVVFVRPVTIDKFARGDEVKLYHRPGETKDSPVHGVWHREAARLLGLGATDYTGADYIAQLVVWRRSVLTKLHDYLEQINGHPWQKSLIKRSQLSEYILYGIYAERVLANASGHFLDTQDLVHSSWHYEGSHDGEMDRFVADFADHHLAVLVQSTTELPLTERRLLIERMTTRNRMSLRA